MYPIPPWLARRKRSTYIFRVIVDVVFLVLAIVAAFLIGWFF